MASLLGWSGQGANIIPDLVYARVVRITENGIVITGREVVPRRTGHKANVDQYRQTWWAMVHTAWLGDALDITMLDEFLRPRSDPIHKELPDWAKS